MTRNKKISFGIAVTVGIGAAIGTAFLIKKLVENSESYKNYNQEKDALDYLTDKYGEEALEGKRVMLVDKKKPVTRATIAKDIVSYKMQ